MTWKLSSLVLLVVLLSAHATASRNFKQPLGKPFKFEWKQEEKVSRAKKTFYEGYTPETEYEYKKAGNWKRWLFVTMVSSYPSQPGRTASDRFRLRASPLSSRGRNGAKMRGCPCMSRWGRKARLPPASSERSAAAVAGRQDSSISVMEFVLGNGLGLPMLIDVMDVCFGPYPAAATKPESTLCLMRPGHPQSHDPRSWAFRVVWLVPRVSGGGAKSKQGTHSSFV